MSYKASMEMRAGEVEAFEDGTKKLIEVVYFTDTEGNVIKYPWKDLKQVVLQWIEIEVTDHWDNRDKIAMSKMAEPQQDPNIQKIVDVVYGLPDVNRQNFKLNIQHDPELPGEYKVFHSEYEMDKLASIAGLRMSHEITSMFEDAGFEVGETWSAKEPVVLIDPKVPR